MKLTVTQVRNYLNRLGVSIADGETVDLRTALPLNIAGRYDAVRSEIAGEKCIILFPRSEGMPPDDIALHNGIVRNSLSARPVFAFSRLDREFAARLKVAKVASRRGKCSCRPPPSWNQTVRMQRTKNLSARTSPRGRRLSCLTAFCMKVCQESCGFLRFADA